jgi:hypothetical protein
MACTTVQNLRSPAERHGCRLERLMHDSAGFTVRLVELAPKGRKPLDLPRSIVRLTFGRDSVFVTRVAEP